MKYVKKVIVLSILIIIPSILLAEKVFISDIIDNPSKFYNLKVTLRGRVVDVKVPTSPTSRGYYVLMDNSDKTIKIIANTLPAPEKEYLVTGVVQVDPETQTPFIREISRTTPPTAATNQVGESKISTEKSSLGINTLVIILVLLIVIVIILILVLVLRKPSSQNPPVIQTVQPSPVGSTPPTKTQQVDISQTVSTSAAGKTVQVPSVPAEIVFENGPLAGKHVPLKQETVIGRESGDVIVPESSVSREHAKIMYIGGKYYIENLSTTNPTIVNGEKIEGLKELKDGDEIICGLVKMRFKIL